MHRHRRLLLATALAGLVAAATAVTGSASERAEPGSPIVFASDRATANPGEIYALTAGRAARNVTHSPYADVALATSPSGQGIRLLEQPGGAVAADDRAGRKGVAQRRGRRERGRRLPARAAGVLGRRDATADPVSRARLDRTEDRVRRRRRSLGPGAHAEGRMQHARALARREADRVQDRRSGGDRRSRRGRALHRPWHVRAVVARRQAGRRGGEEHRGPERIRPLDRPRSRRGTRLVARRERRSRSSAPARWP